MSKKSFISELIEYGTGIAITFLVVLGLAFAMIFFLALVALVAFLERTLN